MNKLQCPLCRQPRETWLDRGIIRCKVCEGTVIKATSLEEVREMERVGYSTLNRSSRRVCGDKVGE